MSVVLAGEHVNELIDGKEAANPVPIPLARLPVLRGLIIVLLSLSVTTGFTADHSLEPLRSKEQCACGILGAFTFQ